MHVILIHGKFGIQTTVFIAAIVVVVIVVVVAVAVVVELYWKQYS